MSVVIRRVSSEGYTASEKEAAQLELESTRRRHTRALAMHGTRAKPRGRLALRALGAAWSPRTRVVVRPRIAVLLN